VSLVDDLVAAVKASDPSEVAVHCALDDALELLDVQTADLLNALGAVTATQYAYVDRHVRIPQHQVRQGRRPDAGGPTKVAAIKTYMYKFYKEEIA
jgi:hypothetical protein